MKKILKNKKGFTLMELIVVIAILAILAAILIPTFSSVIKEAHISAAKSEARNDYTQNTVAELQKAIQENVAFDQTKVEYGEGQSGDQTWYAYQDTNSEEVKLVDDNNGLPTGNTFPAANAG